MKELILASFLSLASGDLSFGHNPHAHPHGGPPPPLHVFRPSPPDSFYPEPAHSPYHPAPYRHGPPPPPVFHSTPEPFHHPAPTPIFHSTPAPPLFHPEPLHHPAPVFHSTPAPIFDPHPDHGPIAHLPAPTPLTPRHPLPAPHPRPAPLPLHHGPVHHDDPYSYGPRPFAYEFGVKDHYSGADFAKKEIQDGNGVVTGEYRVALPDGRIQIVTYHADPVTGFKADVSYEGGPPAHPPPPPHAGPHHGPPHHSGGLPIRPAHLGKK